MEKTTLKGINLGSWLLMEGYILGGRNIAENAFKQQFKKANGPQELKEFEKSFRDNYIVKDDFRKIATLGAKVIRLPFNYRLLEKSPFRYSKGGFFYLDKAFKWAEEFSLKIILDLHAACGGQSGDWHADSRGQAMLWEKKSYMHRTYKLWEVIAERYKDSKALYAYDVLNEPSLDTKQIPLLKQFYRNIIKHIRLVDKKTMIFLQGLVWAQRIDFLESLLADCVGVSVHTYLPINYVFNFNDLCSYPGKIDNVYWDKKRLLKSLEFYHKFAVKNKVEILVGEIGITWRGGYFGEGRWVDDILDIFDSFGFDYTYWMYKGVNNGVFPDGLYQSRDNDEFVRKEGPVYGWENYIAQWKVKKTKIVDSWKTKNYTYTAKLGEILKKHFRK
jgi:hypothetical protein